MSKEPAARVLPGRTYETVVMGDPDGSKMTALAVPFDAKEAFGKARAPVVVRIERLGGGKSGKGGYEYRSTVAVIGIQKSVVGFLVGKRR